MDSLVIAQPQMGWTPAYPPFLGKGKGKDCSHSALLYLRIQLDQNLFFTLYDLLA